MHLQFTEYKVPLYHFQDPASFKKVETEKGEEESKKRKAKVNFANYPHVAILNKYSWRHLRSG